ncbi:MAG: LytR C-terminal domain-containing protein [Nocardioidaceae bacterium]
MALPSAFTLGSVAFVVAAGVGLAAVASNASDNPASSKPAAQQPATSHVPQTTPTQPIKTGTKTPATRQPRERRTPVPKVFVEVYNNSGISGLAASRAKILERAGWNVTATDNWYGNIPANTVYYPDNLRPEARQLAKVLDITRLRPAVSPMQFDRLTVILTSQS